MMNNGFGDGTKLMVDATWPTDLMSIERWLPSSAKGYSPWHHLSHQGELKRADASQLTYVPDPPEPYYIPGEVCDPIGYEWFWQDGDNLRSDGELLGMRLIARERKTNFLLDVPPDKTGRLPKDTVSALMRLQKSLESFDG